LRCKASADSATSESNFGSKFGYKVAAIGRGPENSALAKKLGASVYIDSKAVNAAAAL
jgi:hypothetical protein